MKLFIILHRLQYRVPFPTLLFLVNRNRRSSENRNEIVMKLMEMREEARRVNKAIKCALCWHLNFDPNNLEALALSPEFLALKEESRILEHSSNPVCGFCLMKQV